MNNAELTLYGHQARGGRDQPEFQKIITDENGNRQTIWGSEVSMQEILEIQQANLNHPEEGKRKLEKLARENLREMRMAERLAMRHMTIHQATETKSLHLYIRRILLTS